MLTKNAEIEIAIRSTNKQLDTNDLASYCVKTCVKTQQKGQILHIEAGVPWVAEKTTAFIDLPFNAMPIKKN